MAWLNLLFCTYAFWICGPCNSPNIPAACPRAYIRCTCLTALKIAWCASCTFRLWHCVLCRYLGNLLVQLLVPCYAQQLLHHFNHMNTQHLRPWLALPCCVDTSAIQQHKWAGQLALDVRPGQARKSMILAAVSSVTWRRAVIKHCSSCLCNCTQRTSPASLVDADLPAVLQTKEQITAMRSAYEAHSWH